MKQIGIVLLLTALAAIGFIAVRILDRPVRPDAVTPPAGDPATRRGPAPQTPVGPQQRQQQPPARPTTSVDWKSLQKADWIVPLADRWQFDLSRVDFDAEVLCRVGNVEIRRDDYRAYVCLTDANPLVEARLTLHIADEAASRNGGSARFSDGMFDTMFALWADQRGVDRQGALMMQAQSARLGIAGALQMRRWSWEAAWGQFQSVALVEQLPAGMRNRIAGTPYEGVMPSILGRLQEARADLDSPENLRKLMDSLEFLATFWGDARREEAVRRTTTMLDGVLQPGVVAAVHTGPLTEPVEPPWLHPGSQLSVHVDELWPLIGPDLGRVAAEARLREWIWYRVLSSELRARRLLAAPEATWLSYWQEYKEGSAAVLDLAMIQVMLHGYPTLHHYRAMSAIQQGFYAGQPEGWRDEEAVRRCYEENRFFIQRWNPDVEIALFPAQRPHGGGVALDWDAARREAQAMRARVDAGENFSELRVAQQRQLVDTYRELLGDPGAEEFRRQFQLGSLNVPVADLRQRLQEQRFDEMIDCVSVVRSAVVELDVGEVSPPWRTNLGYVIVRVNGAVIAGLEQEFDDVEYAAREFLQDMLFLQWANGVLRGKEFELG